MTPIPCVGKSFPTAREFLVYLVRRVAAPVRHDAPYWCPRPEDVTGLADAGKAGLR